MKFLLGESKKNFSQVSLIIKCRVLHKIYHERVMKPQPKIYFVN